jgi:hypothetical protein
MEESMSHSILVLGLLLTGLLAVPMEAYAHSEGDCANSGISSCNKSHPNNYDARIACANSVLTACASHKHSGSSASFSSATKLKQSQDSPLLVRRK